MSFRITKVMELLPKKDDCCNCGHCTCEVYAMELVAGRVTVEACPSTTTEVKRMLSQVLRLEQDVLSELKGSALPGMKDALAALSMAPARIAGALLAAFPFLAVLWLLSIWLMMH